MIASCSKVSELITRCWWYVAERRHCSNQPMNYLTTDRRSNTANPYWFSGLARSRGFWRPASQSGPWPVSAP